MTAVGSMAGNKPYALSAAFPSLTIFFVETRGLAAGWGLVAADVADGGRVTAGRRGTVGGECSCGMDCCSGRAGGGNCKRGGSVD